MGKWLNYVGLVAILLLAVTAPATARIGGRWETALQLQPSHAAAVAASHKLELRWFERTPDDRWDIQGSFNLQSRQEPLFDASLDRFSYRRFFPGGDLSIGKQPIGGGVGQSWPGQKSPLNIYPEQVWALTGRWNTGLFDFWSGALVYEQEQWQASVRRQGLHGGVRWSGLVWASTELVQLGFDAQFDAGVEWYGDLLLQVYPEVQAQWLAGVDYSWNGFLGVSELRYNQGKWWWFQSISRSLDEFTTAAVAVDIHATDYSQLWTAALEMVLTGQTNLQLSVLLPRGKNDSYYGLLATEVGPTVRFALTHAF